MAKILVADDSDTELTYLLETLKSTPHEVTIARDGKEAEEKVRSQPFDLIILDVIMPEKNGFQVCRALKKDPQFSQIPIILTTSKSADSDKFWGKKQGADVYITKPYTAAELLVAVRSFLPE